MERKFYSLIVNCLVVGALVIFTFGPPTVMGAAPADLKGEAVLTVSNLSDEVTPPHLISKTGGNYPVGFAMHQGLIKFPIDPGLAESWTISPDGKTWTFKLRKNLKFHNGDPCTAEDAKYGMDMCLRPEVPNMERASMGKYIKKVEAVDQYTLAVHLTDVFPDLLHYLWMGFQPLPKAYVKKVGEDAYNKNPYGLGPFILKKHVRNDYLEYEGFKDYWGKGPFIKKFTMKIVPEASTRLAMLKTGACDIADKMVGNVAKEIQNDPKLRIISSEATGVIRLAFPDMYDPKSPTSDKRVRRALNYAIDREGIAEAIFYGLAKPAFTDIAAPWDKSYDPSWKPYPYDPKKAKALLAEAGFAKGFEIAMVASKGGSAPFGPQASEAAASNLLAVGVKCKFREIEPGIYWGKWRKREHHGLAMHMHTFMKGSYRNFNFHRSDFRGSLYKNKDYDKLVFEGLVMADPEKRKAHIRKLIKWLDDDVANIPLVITNGVSGAGPKIADWRPYDGSSTSSGFETIKVK